MKSHGYGVGVEYFMIDHHQETGNRIVELLSSKGRQNENTVLEFDSTLRRHILIEEPVFQGLLSNNKSKGRSKNSEITERSVDLVA